MFAALTANAVAQGNELKTIDDSWHQLRLEFSLENLKIEGSNWLTVTADGYMPSSVVGAPQLPVYVSIVEVPLCDGFDVTVQDAVYDTIKLEGGKVMPAQPSRSKSDTAKHAMEIDHYLYIKDAYYGEEMAVVEPVGIARDRNLARVKFAPVQYNPVKNSLVVCRKAKVTISYRNADQEATMAMFERYHSPEFESGAKTANSLYPKSVRTAAPVRYLIVAHSMFRGQLDNFVTWKRRKGFITDIAYTDSAAVGTTTTSIQAFIQSQYTNATAAKPAPTYLLIVGDHEQIPAFTGTTSSSHITDLYYTTWTSGDHIPDCYYGRFSAQNISQLTPQIQKTLMYEQYTFQDPSFLDRAVMVAGVDGGSSGDYGYTHADPAMDYAITNYINGAHGWSQVMYFKNNTTIVPTGTNVTVGSSASSNSATVRSYYNQGAGLINYSAHGSATSWGTPNFTTSHAADMTNNQKFGLMIGNCCLTNKFETATCLGESVLRKGNYCGAVGYIGGSNSTYWYEDFYWAVGVRNSIGPSMSMAYDGSHLGVYDRVCHTHGEAYNQWVLTQGDLMFQGNMAVESSTSGRPHYYWEIYHLMGDPSVMIYLTQASEMTVVATPTILSGSTTYSVTAAPYAYVALTDTATHGLVAAAFANASGQATLTLPSSLVVGGYELAASAQQYRTKFIPVSVIPPSGPYAIATTLTPAATLLPGSTVQLALTVSNPGNSTANNVVVNLTSVNTAVTLATNSVTISSIPAGGTGTATVNATVAAGTPDGTVAPISCSATWNGCTQATVNQLVLTVVAPKIEITYSGNVAALMPGATATVTVGLTNNGHAELTAASLTFTSPTSLFTLTSSTTMPVSVAPGTSFQRQYTIHADNQLPTGVSIPLALEVTNSLLTMNDTLPIYIGASMCETFESGNFSLTGWTQSAYPWVVIDTNTPAAGNWCARSNPTLSHSQNSDLTIQRTVSVADSISFYYKVSSETNYDKFHFFIDSEELITESGEVAWTRAAFAVPAGTHTFRFSYTKDGSVNRNSDCAWIDNVTLPSVSRPATFRTDTVCVGETYVLGGETINTTEPGHGVALIDSSLIVDYTIFPSYTVNQVIRGCDSLRWNDSLYTSNYYYNQPMTSVYGCDSTIHIEVIIGHRSYDTILVTTQANNYHWNDQNYTESGTYQQTFTNADGCDSVVTMILHFETPGASIDDVVGTTLSIYPSPTAGEVHFDRTVSQVDVYDIRGRKVASFNDVSTIDLSEHYSGVYLLRIPSTGTVARITLLKANQ